MKTRIAALVLALFVCATAGAQTETLYVIEQLVVSVSATADGSGDRVGQIHSGDRVEVLEREGDQARVRIPSGAEGWVRASYLSSAPPMREQLKTRTDELEKLKQEKSKLEADLVSARKAASAAAAAAASAPVQTAAPGGAAPSAATTPATAPGGSPASTTSDMTSAETGQSDVPSSNPPLFSDEGMVPSRPTWIVALVTALATLVIGFALGWRMLDRRIRAKYGGLRIY